MIVHLSQDQAERLVCRAGLPEVRRARYLLALTSGLRDGELSALSWADVDLDATPPVVHVTKRLKMQGDEGWATLGSTKTEDSVRSLPMHSQAAAALKDWKANGWAKLVGHKPRPADPIFPSDAGKFHRPASAEILRRDLAAAGCLTLYAEQHPFDFHATRRSFATWLAGADVAEDVRKRLLGHAAAGVTGKHYTASDLATLSRAVETIRFDLSRVVETAGHGAVCGAVRTKPATQNTEWGENVEPISRLELETCGLRSRTKPQQKHQEARRRVPTWEH